MPKEIKQRVTFNASVWTIYNALMDPKLHAEFTGAKARISSKVGGAFSTYEGYSTGINVELSRGERIVQAWRGADWPEGVYSIVTFAFKEQGRDKCTVTLTQYGVPDKFHDGIVQGWKSYYWTPMKMWLKAKK